MTQFELTVGVGGVLVGGVLNGSFAAPMKAVRAWAWENIWGVYSVVGLFLLPWLLAFATVPHLVQVIQDTSWKSIAITLVFGAGWGVGSVLFGLGIRRMGLAVGYGMIVGLNAPLGSLFPLLVLHREQLYTSQGRALMQGTALVLCGIVLCAFAASIRERAASPGAVGTHRSGLALGLLICILSGIFSPMINFSFIFGAEMQQRALASGASAAMSANVIWAVALTAGCVVNAGYCTILLHRNGTWNRFTSPWLAPSPWWISSATGLLCFGSFVVYGVGATALGVLGGILGWPLFLSMSLITSSVLGALTGEWKGVPRTAVAALCAGILILICAIVLIAQGGQR